MTPSDALRTPPPDSLRQHPVIAVLRASAATDYDPVVDTLVEHGVTSIEVTLSTPRTLERLPHLLAQVGDAAQIGVGTITDARQARAAIEAGAHYLVTPVASLEVVAVAIESGVPVYPGGLTPTEVFTCWSAGASAVKVFPAESVGPQYGGHLRGPFPELEFIPSGGITLDDIGPWLQAGATAVSLGGPLVGDALRGGDLRALGERARAAVREASAALASIGPNR